MRAGTPLTIGVVTRPVQLPSTSVGGHHELPDGAIAAMSTGRNVQTASADDGDVQRRCGSFGEHHSCAQRGVGSRPHPHGDARQINRRALCLCEYLRHDVRHQGTGMTASLDVP